MPAPIVAALLAVAIAVARHKLVDATGGVHQLRFAGIERVTRVRDLKLDKRILNAVDFNRVLGSCCRAAEELSTVRHIFENPPCAVTGSKMVSMTRPFFLSAVSVYSI